MTSEERREVAARLRELDYADLQESLVCAYLDALGIEGYMDWIGIAHRLADLIDPTCEVVGTTSEEGLYGPTIFHHELSCGHTCDTVRPEPPNHCDECGARVVERDNRYECKAQGRANSINEQVIKFWISIGRN